MIHQTLSYRVRLDIRNREGFRPLGEGINNHYDKPQQRACFNYQFGFYQEIDDLMCIMAGAAFPVIMVLSINMAIVAKTRAACYHPMNPGCGLTKTLVMEIRDTMGRTLMKIDTQSQGAACNHLMRIYDETSLCYSGENRVPCDKRIFRVGHDKIFNLGDSLHHVGNSGTCHFYAILATIGSHASVILMSAYVMVTFIKFKKSQNPYFVFTPIILLSASGIFYTVHFC